MLVAEQYGFDGRTGEISWIPPAPAAAQGNGLGAWPVLVVMGIQAGIQVLMSRKGGKQKRTTTMIVDEAERLLIENVELYLAGQIDQATAIQNFESVWVAVVDQCKQPAMGEPGQRCVSERERGGQWDWFARYRDPIGETPQPAAVGPDGRAVAPTQAAGILPGADFFTPSSGELPVGTLLLAGLAIAVALSL